MEVKFAFAWLLSAIPFVHTVPWGYPETKPGTDYWPKIFPLYCAGLSQSPINIDTGTAVKMYPGSFQLTGFSAGNTPKGAQMIVANSGSSAQINLVGDYFVSGGGLPGEQYRAKGIHFHWGSNNEQGSEHTIDGRKYAAEMHVVTYDTKFASVSEAAYKVDGLAVLGFFIELQPKDNPAFASFFYALSQLRYKGTSRRLQTPFPIADMFPSTNIMQPYFRYRGSLTTPTCNEVVVWTVFKMPIRVSQKQLNVFRTLLINEPEASQDVYLADNYRPPQPLNGRTVFHSAGVIRVT